MKSFQHTFAEFCTKVKNKLSPIHTTETPDLFTWQPLDGNTHRVLVKRFRWRLFWQHLKFKLGVSKPLSYAKGTLGVHLVALSEGKRVRCIHNQTGEWKVVDFDAPVVPLDPPNFKKKKSEDKDERDDPRSVLPEPGIPQSLMVKVALDRVATERPKLAQTLTPELTQTLDKVLSNPPPKPPTTAPKYTKDQLVSLIDNVISELKEHQQKNQDVVKEPKHDD
jgi:hypothetical protein